jgi:hypothetical protein
MKEILKGCDYNVPMDGDCFPFRDKWYDIEDFYPDLSGKADYIMAEGFHTIYVKLNKDGTADVERFGPPGLFWDEPFISDDINL